jgi:hypothetical protein
MFSKSDPQQKFSATLKNLDRNNTNKLAARYADWAIAFMSRSSQVRPIR